LLFSYSATQPQVCQVLAAAHINKATENACLCVRQRDRESKTWMNNVHLTMSYRVGVASAAGCFPLTDNVGRNASKDSPSRIRVRLSSRLNFSARLKPANNYRLLQTANIIITFTRWDSSV